MDKYRRVIKDKSLGDRADAPKNEIRVTSLGRTGRYISYAGKLLKDEKFDSFTIRATGTALSTAITVAEIMKRRFRGLHQIAKIGCTEVEDEYEPLEEGLEPVKDVRNISFIEIKLTTVEPEEKPQGYQAPVADDLVKEFDEIDSRVKTAKNSGKRRDGRKGKGKGKAKVKDDDEKEVEEKVEKPRKGRSRKKSEKVDEEEEEVKPTRSRRARKGKGKKEKEEKHEAEEEEEIPKRKGSKKGRGKSKGKGKRTAESDSEEEEYPKKGKGKKGKGKGKESKGKGKGKGKKGKGKGKKRGGRGEDDGHGEY